MKVFRIVGESTTLLIGAGMLQMISIMFMMSGQSYLLRKFNAGSPPDMRFGYTSDEIYEWLEKLGPDGRKHYLDLVYWDFFPMMPTYAVLLGSLLYEEIKHTEHRNEIAYVFPVTMLFDVVETAANGYTAYHFPDPVDSYIVDISSLANQMKWLALGSGLFALSLIFLQNLVYPSLNTKSNLKEE